MPALPISCYAASASAPTLYPALDGSVSADVAIIGGGLSGLSTALSLAERGLSVVLVEARRVASGASGASGGHILSGFHAPMRDVQNLLGPEDAQKLWDITIQSKRHLKGLIEKHNINCNLNWGYIYAGRTKRQEHQLKKTLEYWKKFLHYTKARYIQGDDFRSYVGSECYLSGIYDPTSGNLNPLALSYGLADACHKDGVKIFEQSPAISIFPKFNGNWNIQCKTGFIKSKHVVLCGNAYMRNLLPEAEAWIAPVRCWMVATEPLGELARKILPHKNAVTDWRIIPDYYHLSEDNRLIFGSGCQYIFQNFYNHECLLKNRLTNIFPDLKSVKITNIWNGDIAVTKTRLPTIGAVDAYPSLWIAQGYNGIGISLSIYAGLLISEAIVGSIDELDYFDKIPRAAWNYGVFRNPILALKALWTRLQDRL